ncbi:MAG TPA: DUF4388 domain-containing protein [Coleofasciculaceae cyanobacterium]
MSTQGSLTDFSLLEILQFIENGKRTGLLTLSTLFGAKTKPVSVYYIWVYRGRLLAIANRLDRRGLIELINQQQWVSERVVTKLAQLCPSNQPLGLYLLNQGVLNASQLKQLFFLQVLQQIEALFQLNEAQFRFDPNVLLPSEEMTGLSVSARSLRLVTTPRNALITFYDGSNLVPLSEQEWVEQRNTEIFSNWAKHQITEQYKSNSHYSRILAAS